MYLFERFNKMLEFTDCLYNYQKHFAYLAYYSIPFAHHR